MKTTIEIRGQIKGNYLLRSAIHDGFCVEKSTGTGFQLIFGTKYKAIKALVEARKYLRMEGYDFDWSKESISYDASRAFISISHTKQSH